MNQSLTGILLLFIKHFSTALLYHHAGKDECFMLILRSVFLSLANIVLGARKEKRGTRRDSRRAIGKGRSRRERVKLGAPTTVRRTRFRPVHILLRVKTELKVANKAETERSNTAKFPTTSTTSTDFIWVKFECEPEAEFNYKAASNTYRSEDIDRFYVERALN